MGSRKRCPHIVTSFAMNLRVRFRQTKGWGYRLASALVHSTVSTRLIQQPVGLLLVLVTLLLCFGMVHVRIWRAVSGFSRYKGTSSILNGLELGWQFSAIESTRIWLWWCAIHVSISLLVSQQWNVKEIALGSLLGAIVTFISGVIGGVLIGVIVSILSKLNR